MNLISIGIDNGLTGAVVAVDENMTLSHWDTPIITMGGKKSKRQYNEVQMLAILSNIRKYSLDDSPLVRIQAWIEHAQAYPKEGRSSCFKTGLGHGLWRGLCVGMGIPYQIVHPRSWTKEMLKDAPAGDTKKRSVLVCQRLFPKFVVTGPRGGVLDGRADAALIAVYGLRQMLGNG